MPDGISKEVTGYGPTKQAATDDLYKKVQATLEAFVQVDTLSVRELFAEFLQHKRSVKGNKAKTMFNDIKDFRLHIAPAIGDLPVVKVTLRNLQDIQYTLTRQEKYRSAELVTVLLKSFYKYIVKRYRDEIEAGLKLRNVAADLDNIKRPPDLKAKPELWTIDQVQAFLAHSKRRYDSPKRSLMYPLFYTALAAGLRRGELLGLKQGALRTRMVAGVAQHQLCITEQLVHYDKKHHRDTPKTRMGVRDVPIPSELVAVLKLHIAKLQTSALDNPDWIDHGLMFPSYNGTPLEPSNIYRAKDETIAALELPKSTLHMMRKVYSSYVTRNMIQAGTFSPKRLQALLGHSSPDTAVKIYTQVIQNDTAGTTFDPFASRVVGIEVGTDTLRPSDNGNGEPEGSPSTTFILGSDEET